MNPIHLGFILALVATGGLFFASVGATTPLAAAGLPNTGLNPASSPGIAGAVPVNGQTAGVNVNVQISQPQGQPIVSGVRAGQTSDFIGFSVSASTPSGCGGGSSDDPAFRWGSGALSAYAMLTLISGSGHYIPFSTNPSGLNQTTYVWSFNNTPVVSGFCWNENTCAIGCGSADYTSNVAGQALETVQPIQLYGAYQNAILQVQFVFGWLDCGNTGNQGVPACNAHTSNGAGSPCTSLGYASTNCNQITTGGTATATAQTVMYSGSANVYPLSGGGLYFNGQTMTFGATTGYGGQSAWTAQVVDVGRNGGGVDPAFPPISVGNGLTTQFSWVIPSGWSTISSVQNYNELQVQLVSSFFNLPTTPVQVDINPSYAPGTPQLTYSVSGGQLLPSLGSTVTISIIAASPSQPISTGGSVQALVFSYYLQNGQDVHTLPGSCGNYWISSGCQSGQLVQLTPSGSSWSGTFVFTVNTANLPIGTLVRTVVSNTQQGSNNSALVINQIPSGCNPGSTCYPTPPTSASFWDTLGPYAFAAFIVTAAAAIGYFGRHLNPYLIAVVPAIGVVAAIVIIPLAQAWYLTGVL